MNIPPELAPPPLIRHGGSALHSAVEAGNKILIALFIQQRYPVDATNTENRTPLHVAAQKGIIESVTLLINAGANPNAQDCNGYTPLHWAILCRHTAVALSLIENGANVDVSDADGKTPLHLAATIGDSKIIHALIDVGANTNATTRNQFTPLHFAAYHGHTWSVITLIQHGAHVNARSRNNFTPLHQALSFQHTPLDFEIQEVIASPLVREVPKPHEMGTLQNNRSTQKLTTALALLVYGKAYPHDITYVEENPIRQYIARQYDLAQSEATTRLTPLAKALFPSVYATSQKATTIATLKLYGKITQTTNLYYCVMALFRCNPKLPQEILWMIMGYMCKWPTLLKLDFTPLRVIELPAHQTTTNMHPIEAAYSLNHNAPHLGG